MGFAITLFAGIAVAAVFVLRAREPQAPRPFKALGYPIAPAVFVLASGLIVLNALWSDLVIPVLRNEPWGPTAVGVLVIAAGLPLYFLFARRSRSAGSP